MTDIYLNYLRYIAILENIKMCSNKWLIVYRIIHISKKIVKPFKCVKKNELRFIEKCYLQNIFRLVSLFNGISTFIGYLMLKLFS